MLRPLELSIEEKKVLAWRREEFARLGFEATTADLLACDFRIDLHRAAALVALGCPHEIAARILL